MPDLTQIDRDAAPSKKLWDFLKVEMAFVKEFACAPFHVGSICPSSRTLASQLAGMAQNSFGGGAAANGLIIDLGAGPGPVTGELLRAGVAPERIVAVERSPSFTKAFRDRYRQVPIFTGDAANLRHLLDTRYPDTPLCAIISSLPLRAIPRKAARGILREVHAALTERGGTLVQYSYWWWAKHSLRSQGFAPCNSRLVLQNVPPARVECYTPEPGFRPKRVR